MAWSDAARAAALEARRRRMKANKMALQVRNVALTDYEYRGIRRDPFYATQDYRARLAAQIRAVRGQIRRGKLGRHERSKIKEVLSAAGRAQWHKRGVEPFGAGRVAAIGRVRRHDARFPSTHGMGKGIDDILNSWKKG